MNINFALVQAVVGPIAGGAMVYFVMRLTTRNKSDIPLAPTLGIPKKPLPPLVERLNTHQGHFTRPARPASENGAKTHRPAEECTYLATDYSTPDGEIVRLMHDVQPPGYMTRSMLEAQFLGEDAVAYVLEYELDDVDGVDSPAGDEGAFVLTRHYPGPDPVPAAAYQNPEFGNILEESVYATGGGHRSIWLKSGDEIANEEWFSRNELLLELDDLPQEATYA